MSRVLCLVVVSAVLALSGCSDDPEPRADPTNSSPAADNPCAKITEAQLSEWAGTEQVQREPSIQGVLVRCGTLVSDDDMVLSWRFKPLVNSLEAEGAAAELPGLTRRSIQLDGSTPAWLLTGAVVGPRVAEVVTVLGDQTLIVNATTAGVDAAVTSKTLEAMATQIAAAYAA